MKKLKFILIAFLTVMATTAWAHEKTDTIRVNGGNCAACKVQIESALKVDGISKAEWNAQTKLLIVTYNTHKITNADIQKKIADAGFDTDTITATEEAYNKLDKCCQYRSETRTKIKTKSR